MPDIAAPKPIERLLEQAVSRGSTLIRRLAADALSRRLRSGHGRGGQFFTDAERLELARSIAATTAAADLLGRQRLRSTLRAVRFSEDSEWLAKMLTPRAALDYLRSTRVDPDAFEIEHEGRAFQLAVTTDAEILDRIFNVITDRIETGKAVRDTPGIISRILDDAGIEHNAGYGELVWRTTAMESYRNGAWKEYQDPDVGDLLPVWRYIGVRDGRQRPSHFAHCGKYWPREISFQSVRGTSVSDVINCRCDWVPINRLEWKRLQARGVTLEPPP